MPQLINANGFNHNNREYLNCYVFKAITTLIIFEKILSVLKKYISFNKNLEVKMPKLGLRTIKTSISVFFCVIISSMFGIDPFYSCIASVSTTQSSIKSSFKAGKDRMLGSGIGAFWGIVFSYLGQNSPFWTGLGILSVIYTTTVLRNKGAVNIACIVLIAIMVDPTVTDPIINGSQRLIQTLLGIVIAVLVNLTIVPPNE
jgi:uncharacterized membrane protein YgaE (UPF0421/DUF939 family)